MVEISEVPPQRSTFVTVVAWLMMAVYIFKAAVSALQAVILWTIFSMGEFQEAMDEIHQDPEAPDWFATVFANMHWFAALSFVLAAGMIGVSIGLLRRKEWARKIFIVVLGLKVSLAIASLLVMPLIFGFLVPWQEFLEVNDPAARPFLAIWLGMMALMGVFTLAINGLYVWVIWKLTRSEIRREFQVPEPATSLTGG